MADDDTARDESTLVDDLEAAFDAAEADDADEPEAAEEAETEEAAEPEETATDPDDTPADADEEGGEGGEGDEDETVSLDPDEHWDEATKEAFGALPDEAKPLYRDKVRALDATYDAKFQEVAAERKGLDQYRQFDEIFAPYRQDLALAGLDAPAYVQQLMAIADRMRSDAPATLQWLAQQNGVDLQNLTGEADEFADPVVRNLESKVDQLQSTITQNAQATQVAQAQQAQAEIDAFRDAVDAQGTAVHPHFDSVTPLMSSLMASGQASDMESAYQMAVRAHPELGAQVIQAEVQKTLANKQAVAKQTVAKSKKAAKNAPVKKVAAVESAPDAGTHRDELERQWDEMTAT